MQNPDEIYYGNQGYASKIEMVAALNIAVYPEDKVRFFPDPSLGIGSKIYIYRANPVKVIDGKRVKIYRTWMPTVEKFLEEKNIELGDKDKITPSLSSPIEKNQKIVINRVAETTVTDKIVLPFDVITKDNPNLERGKTSIEQEGKNGLREKKYLVRREDGIEVNRKLLSDEITAKPQNKIIINGTKVNFIVKGKKATFMRQGYVSANIAAMNGMAGKKILVRNLNNGKEVEVYISGGGLSHNDSNVVIDLSYESFGALGGSYGNGFLTNIGIAIIQ